MHTNERIVAATELILIFPAALFLTAVVARHVPPLQPEPAQTAEQIVTWYVVRSWTLWTLLIDLPFAALITGGATLLQNSAARLPTRIIQSATTAAALILVVVALHMLAN